MLFRERLTVPAVWWLLAGLFALSVLLAVGAYLGPVWAVGTTLAALLVDAALFASASIVLRVDTDQICAGRESIEPRYIAGCRALNTEETRRRTGVEADARAHMVLRP